MTIGLTIASILAFHLLTGMVFGRLKIREYLDVTPTENLSLFKRMWRYLLFPIFSRFHWNHKGNQDYDGYTSVDEHNYVSLLVYIDTFPGVPFGDIKTVPDFYSVLRSQATSKEKKDYIAKKYLVSSAWTGFIHFLPLVVAVIMNICVGAYLAVGVVVSAAIELRLAARFRLISKFLTSQVADALEKAD